MKRSEVFSKKTNFCLHKEPHKQNPIICSCFRTFIHAHNESLLAQTVGPGMVLRHCAGESAANKTKYPLLWGGGRGAAITTIQHMKAQKR